MSTPDSVEFDAKTQQTIERKMLSGEYEYEPEEEIEMTPEKLIKLKVKWKLLKKEIYGIWNAKEHE